MMSVTCGAFRFARKGGGLIGLRAGAAAAIDCQPWGPLLRRDVISNAITPCIERLEQRLCLSATAASAHPHHHLSVFENDVNVVPHGCVPPKGYAFGHHPEHHENHGRHEGRHKDEQDDDDGEGTTDDDGEGTTDDDGGTTDDGEGDTDAGSGEGDGGEEED